MGNVGEADGGRVSLGALASAWVEVCIPWVAAMIPSLVGGSEDDIGVVFETLQAANMMASRNRPLKIFFITQSPLK
jgi:hypothetical protein